MKKRNQHRIPSSDVFTILKNSWEWFDCRVMTKKTNKKMFKGEALWRPIHIVTYGACIHHSQRPQNLPSLFLSTSSFGCLSWFDWNRKQKSKEKHKKLVSCDEQKCFPIVRKTQHKRWKQTLLVHEYDYAMVSKGRNEKGRQGRDKKLLSF